MDLSNLFSRLIVLFIYIIVGFIAAKVGKLDEDVIKKVNTVLLYIGQPALIINSVLSNHLDIGIGELGYIFMLAVIMQILLLGISYIFTPIYVREKSQRGLFKFMTAFGNTGFMGFPVISALFGDDAIFLAAVFLIPFFLASYSIGIIQIKGRESGAKLSFRFLLNPALVATFVGVVLFFLRLPIPGEIMDACSGLAGILIPLSMVAIGANIGMRKISELWADWRMYILSLVKLCICPVLMFFSCRLFVFNEIYLGIMVVSSAMPSAVLASMFATEYGTHIHEASRGVFITTLLSLFTIPAVMNILF